MLEILSAILDNLTVGVVVVDKNLTIKYANEYFKNRVKGENGVKIEENNFGNVFRCKNTSETVMCGTTESCQTCEVNHLLKSILEEKKECCFEIENSNEKFKFVRDESFEFRGSSLILEGEEYIKLELHEITEKKNLEITLKDKEKNEQQLEAFLDAMEDMVFYMDSNRRIKYCNKAYAKFLNLSLEEVLGKKESEIFPEDMIEKCESNTRIAFERGLFLEEEELMGKWFQTFKCRIEIDENGEIGILCVVRDITSQKTRELELKDLAYLDLLTGLFNRNFFEDKVQEIMRKNVGKNCSLMIMDIDNFKTLNDTLGHEAGDRCLKDISEILIRNIRKEDYPIRMGGDELCVLTFSDKNPAETMGERVLKEVGELRYSERGISVSIGTSTQTKAKETLEELYKKADMALYKAKENGKNRIERN